MQAALFRQLDCDLAEGPLWTDDGLVFFDILAADMHRISEDGERLDSWHIEQMASAAALTQGPDLLIATETALVTFNPDTGDHAHLCPLEADTPATRSNDGRADRQGGFWIGTMGKHAEPGAGTIYRYYKGELRALRGGITIPNAICFAPQGETAYFADSALGQVFSWRLDADGWPIGAPMPFHRPASPDWAPDGAVIDERGDMWIAYWGGARVAQVTPDGTARAHIDLPVPQPSCPAFGPDATLYITTAREGMSAEDLAAAPFSGSIFAAPLPVEGLPEPRVILP